MTSLEDDLRDALHADADTVHPRASLESMVWPRARRRRRRLLATAWSASALAGLGCVAGVVLIAGRSAATVTITGGRTGAVAGAASATSSATPPAGTATPAPAPAFSWSPPPADGACLHPAPADGEPAVPQLAGVCLPHPAPGFPYRAGPDVETARGVFASGQHLPIATFALSSLPWNVERDTAGRELALEVATRGAFGTRDDGSGHTSQGSPVTAITAVRGTIGTVVRVDQHQIGLLVSTPHFDIAAYGTADPAGRPVTVAELVAVINALHGVD